MTPRERSNVIASRTSISIVQILIVMQMAQFQYFQPTVSLPTIQEMELGDTVTQSPNSAVLCEVQAKQPGKCKACTTFTAERRATIQKYASEHGNEATVKNSRKPIIKIQDTLVIKRINKNHIYLLGGQFLKI